MILMTPGPTPVSEATRLAMATPSIHHRTPEFEEIFAQTRGLLKKLFAQDEVIVFGSSGTGAMESALQSFCSQKALIINAGKFGERFVKIAQSHKIPYQELLYDSGDVASAQDIEAILEEDTGKEIDCICIQICESSSGVRHPVEEIAKRVKSINPDIFIVADGITALGVEPIETTHIDALIGGSQKAFMLPPGLSMIGLSQQAVNRIELQKVDNFYFNLKKELQAQRGNTTAYTPPTTLIIGLQEVLKRFFDMGLDTLFAQTANRSIATREALNGIGLEIFPKNPSFAMTAIRHPQAKAIKSVLKNEFSLNIAGGQGDLKEKIFRINNMGIIPLQESLWAVNAIEMALHRLNIRPFDALANKIFFEHFM